MDNIGVQSTLYNKSIKMIHLNHTLEQLGVISVLNDNYRESHGLASSNALDSAFDELENALDDALADSSSSVSMAEPESETVSVAESTVYDEPEEYLAHSK